MKTKPISVFIMDRSPLVGHALARLLKDTVEIEVVATATEGPAALTLASQLQPDVALVAAGGLGHDGMWIARRLQQLVPATHVVVLSAYTTFRDQALDAGACRFLLEDCGHDELVADIRLAALGQCLPNENSRHHSGMSVASP